MAEQGNTKKEKGGINLFRIAGIQVTIDISWFIIFFLVLWSLSAGYFPRQFPGQSAQTYWIAGLFATLMFFFSVLFHEISHSLVALRSGINITEITLFIFGGVSRLSEEAKTPASEFAIAIVGPLSSFFLALVFWIFRTALEGMHFPMAVGIFYYLTWINVALGVFNLLPGFPLDGGRVLRAILWHRTGSLAAATKYVSDMGKGLAIALMILGGFQIFAGFLIGGLWLIFIGVFLRGVAEGGYQEVLMRQSLEGVRVQEVMVDEVVSVPRDLSVSQLIHKFFMRYGFKGFPVVSNGEVLGVISLSDVKDVPEGEQETTTVNTVMTPLNDAMTIQPDVSLADAMKKMAAERVGRLLVMRENRMVGIITKTGLMRFLEIRRILEK